MIHLGGKQMKKLISVLLILVMVFSFAACGGGGSDSDMQITLITDKGNIDDKSFNQGSWEGVIEFAEANGLKEGTDYRYIKPEEASDAGYLAAIDLAVEGGANVVVCPGFLFEVAVYEAQTKYPDVKFLIIDGAPHTADYSVYETKSRRKICSKISCFKFLVHPITNLALSSRCTK
mgnify:CR=1 FL=1